MDTVQNISNIIVSSSAAPASAAEHDSDIRNAAAPNPLQPNPLQPNPSQPNPLQPNPSQGLVDSSIVDSSRGSNEANIDTNLKAASSNDSTSLMGSSADDAPKKPASTDAERGIPGPSKNASFRVHMERKEFSSRPNWSFTHNENVSFCSALQHLRFTDQNHVPRKFIEEWFQEHMVSLDTMWPAGQRYISESVKEMERNPEKGRERQSKEVNTRRKNIFKNRKVALAHAEQQYRAAQTIQEKDAAGVVSQAAQADASVPEAEIPVKEPDFREVALVELGIKIMRRLQGQTDRMDMAEDLAKEKFVDDVNNYFATLQVEVEKAIIEKHNEIALEREKVETKSKQSRKRRRSQVSNGITLSGSATRVRFTNREMAMLIHWIYTYPKSEWTQHIYEYYSTPDTARSAEHVRDKMRDLITRSKDTAKGGSTTMKTRSAGTFMSKPGEPLEVQELARHDLADFKYPDGVLEQVPGGRYFDEERSAWVDGPSPVEYIARYHEEIMRIMRVVQSKVDRTQKANISPPQGPPMHRGPHDNPYRKQPYRQFQDQQLQQQHSHQQQHLQQQSATNSSFDDAFVAQAHMSQPHTQGHQPAPPAFPTDDDFNLVSIWNENNKQSNHEEAAVMAAAASKNAGVPSHAEYFSPEAMDDKEIKRARHN